MGKTNMKIQISPTRIVKDALTVWNEAGPEVDIVMDLKNLGFAENSIEAIYSFHVIEHLFDSEILEAIGNWKKCMMPGKDMFIVTDNWEHLCRLYVGGELNIFDFNKNFSYPTKISEENMIQYLHDNGYPDGNVRLWYADVPDLFKKKDHELIVAAKK